MKMKLTIIPLLFSLFTSAQDSSNRICKSLLNAIKNKPVNAFNLSPKIISDLNQNISFLQNAQISQILPFDNGWIIPENGTGRLFSIDSTGNISQLDNTSHGGDRFGAFVFVYNDTIYSMGGYGFWRVTGAVRYFNPNTKEWNIIKTSNNIKLASGVNAHFLYSKNEHKVFALYKNYPDEYAASDMNSEEKEKVYVQIFDLKTKDWSASNFILNKKLGKEFQDLRIVTTAHQSIFLHSKYYAKTLELDFSKNEFYELEDRLNTEWIELTKKADSSIHYATDSSLNILDLSNQSSYSIHTRSLNKKRIDKIYSTSAIQHSLSTQHFIIAGLIISNLILLFAFFFFYKNRKQQKREIINDAHSSEEFETLTKVKSFTDLLDDIEKKVVCLLSKNYKEGRLTSIDEINKTLGIEKRPYKIRNNMRADVLKLINKKFMDFSSSTNELIIRERSEFDKRYFEYTLNDRYANKIGNATVES